MLPKRLFFILDTTHLWSISTHDVNHHISYNPSSILITGSLFLLTLIRSSFSSLDSKYYPHTIPLMLVCNTMEQLAASPTISLCTPLIPSSLLHTQHSNLPRFHHIRHAGALPLPVTIPTFRLATLVQSKFRIKTAFMATKYSHPQKENRE